MATLYKFCKFATHTRTRTSNACRRLASDSTTPRRIVKQYTLREMNEQLEPYTRSLALVGWGFILVLGVVVYVDSLHRQIAVNNVEAEKKIVEAEKKMIEAVALAEKNTAERFLLYGYAEEFARYQQKVGIYKGAEEENKVEFIEDSNGVQSH